MRGQVQRFHAAQADHALHQQHGVTHAMGAEERLRHQHCHEGQQDAQGTLDSAHLARGSRLASDDENPPGRVHRQVHGVQQPEDDELQTRAPPGVLMPAEPTGRLRSVRHFDTAIATG
ncbi:hypothetical protein G6F63_016001 [Rhizopus arrhizus]|nr:hypothetical protein G6F63_016001 [Rhizopus arrhizus]